MIISYQKLQTFFDASLPTPDALYDQVTAVGLEGEEYNDLAEQLDHFICARVAQVESIEDGRYLKLQLDAGTKQCQVVCGDTTIRQGELVAYAPVGALLGDQIVAAKKVGGAESAGLLVSGLEIGLDGQGDGVLRVPEMSPGSSLKTLTEDVLFDLGITPNRGDCFSHLGVAREVGAIVGQVMKTPDFVPLAADYGPQPVVLQDDDSPYYIGVSLTLNQHPNETPQEVKELVGRSGMRCISPLVDITNFVMLELGQPMHAFDADTIVGNVVVRAAKAEETLVTLDGQERTFLGGELVIADNEGPIAIAGVMGGQRTEVTDSTRNVLLESAYFAPMRVARSRRPLGLSTEASMRFERGVDFAGVERAASRFLDLLAQVADFDIVGVQRAGTQPSSTTAPWDYDRALRLLGDMPSQEEANQILENLGFAAANNETVRHVPSWRPDIVESVDLAEEVARIWGLDRFSETLPALEAGQIHDDALFTFRNHLLDWLTAQGCLQGIHLSFTHHQTPESIELANPLGAQTRFLQTDLATNMLAAASRNHKHQELDFRLTEISKAFQLRDGQLEEAWRCGILFSGRHDAGHWQDQRAVDYYDLRGLLDRLLASFGLQAEYEPTSDDPRFHPYRQAKLVVQGELVGCLGEASHATRDELAFKSSVVYGEFDVAKLHALVTGVVPPTHVALPKFPASERDLAFVLPEAVASSALTNVIREAAGQQLSALNIFDIYAGKGLPEAHRSIAIRLQFRHQDRTLEQEEVDTWTQQAVDAVKNQLGGTLR